MDITLDEQIASFKELVEYDGRSPTERAILATLEKAKENESADRGRTKEVDFEELIDNANPYDCQNEGVALSAAWERGAEWMVEYFRLNNIKKAKENEWISVEEDQRGKEKLFMTILTKIYGKDHRHRATVNAILGIMLIDLHMEQLSLIKHGISVMVKHYESGTFSYTIMKHNGDATGWNKISPFMAQSFDNYRSALEGGIKFFKEWEIENKQTDKLK